MQKQIGLGRNGRLAPPEDFSRKATHCRDAFCYMPQIPPLRANCYKLLRRL